MRVHFQPTDPGTRWVKDPGVVIEPPDASGTRKALTPNVVDVPGGYRMYYTVYETLVGSDSDSQLTRGNVLSAFSTDGSRWELESGVRLAPHEPTAGQRVVCPDVIPTDDGGWRMYFEAQPFDGPSSIGSAYSRDGLTFDPEPAVRFGEGVWRYGSPRVLPTNGGFRMYFHRYTHPLRMGLDAGNHIISAFSRDGMTFEQEAGVRIAQESPLEDFAVYAPEVIRLGDASYRMYYAGWTVEPVRGRVFSARSTDGLAWTKDPEINLDFGGRYDAEKCSEPCVTRLPDGRYRMFYEACDEQHVWRILSATAAG